MNWFQLIITIVSSSALTAVITGFFDWQSIKQLIKRLKYKETGSLIKKEQMNNICINNYKLKIYII